MGKVTKSKSRSRSKNRDEKKAKKTEKSSKSKQKTKQRKRRARRESSDDDDSNSDSDEDDEVEVESESDDDNSSSPDDSENESSDSESNKVRKRKAARRKPKRRRDKSKKKKKRKDIDSSEEEEEVSENEDSDDDEEDGASEDERERDRRSSNGVRLNEFNWRHSGNSEDEAEDASESANDDDDDDDAAAEVEGDNTVAGTENRRRSSTGKRASQSSQSDAQRATVLAEIDEEKKKKLQKRTQVTVTKMLRAYMMKGSKFIGVYGLIMTIMGIVLSQLFSFSISVVAKNPLGLTLPVFCYIIGGSGLLAASCGVYMHMYAKNPNHFMVLVYSVSRVTGTLTAFWAMTSHVLVYELKPFMPDGISRHGERIMYFVIILELLYPVLAGPCYIRRFHAIWGAYQRSFDLGFFQLPPDTPTFREFVVRNTPPVVSRLFISISSILPKRTNLHLKLKEKLRKGQVDGAESPDKERLLPPENPQHPAMYYPHPYDLEAGFLAQQQWAAANVGDSSLPPSSPAEHPGFKGLPPLRIPGAAMHNRPLPPYPSPLHASNPSFQQLVHLASMHSQNPTSPLHNFHTYAQPQFAGTRLETTRSHQSQASHTATPGQPYSVIGNFLPPEPEEQPFYPARVPGLDPGAVISPDEFKMRWVSMPTTGSFKCSFSASIDADGVGKHMAQRGFNFIASGFIPESNTLKCYFFGQYKGVAFLTELGFQFELGVVRITFKCQEHDGAPHFVKLFELHEMLGETTLVKDDANPSTHNPDAVEQANGKVEAA